MPGYGGSKTSTASDQHGVVVAHRSADLLPWDKPTLVITTKPSGTPIRDAVARAIYTDIANGDRRIRKCIKVGAAVVAWMAVIPVLTAALASYIGWWGIPAVIAFAVFARCARVVVTALSVVAGVWNAVFGGQSSAASGVCPVCGRFCRC